MTMFGSQWLANAGGAGYQIDQSIRFDSVRNSDLTRTLSGDGNLKTGTFSFWMKRSGLGSLQEIFTTYSIRSSFFFNSNDTLAMQIYNGASYTTLTTTAVFRDPSAFAHYLFRWDTTQATDTDRLQFYYNGVLQTVTGTYPAQDSTTTFSDATYTHVISGDGSANTLYEIDGYLAEIHYVDGTALAATDFGEYNADGVWVPIEYTGGSYGTNGFYITGATASDLGEDFSGNNNDYTSSGLATTDQMPDTPTLNHWTLNPLDSGSTLANGNLQNKGGGSTNTHAPAFPKTGKWYVEIDCIDINTGTAGAHFFGICDASVPYSASFSDHAATSAGQQRGGQLKKDNSNTSSGTAVNDGDVIALAFDADNLTLDLYVNNSASGSQITGLTDVQYKLWIQDGGTVTNMQFNFAEASFEYTPPTGFKALSTANLPTPSITDGSAYFQPTIYTGNGTAIGSGGLEVNQSGNSTFQPDFAWIKNRTTSGNEHDLYDAVRGATKVVFSSTAGAEATVSEGLTSFDTDGFTVGNRGEVNTSGNSMVAWQWLANGSGSSNTDGSITSTVSANTTAGFSIVKYTGTGANATVGHGLGVVPKMILIKDTTNTESWIVYHEAVGNDGNLYLNLTNAKATQAVFQDTTPTSSVFSLGTTDGANKASGVHIAYCFAEIPGYSSIGSYTGNSSTDGPFVYTGFKPAFVLFKVSSNAPTGWVMLDNQRDTYNAVNHVLQPNESSAESSGSDNWDILSNGFKVRTTWAAVNGSGYTVTYMAFAKHPFGGDGVAPATAR